MKKLISKIATWWHKRYATKTSQNKTKTDDDINSMTNVVNSMFLCQPLYDKLKSKCHPDRFVETIQKEKAEVLFKELQKYRYNIEKLNEIAPLIEELYNKQQ